MHTAQTTGEVIVGRRARMYDARKTLWSAIRRRHTSLIRLEPGMRLLDVGCGTGFNLVLVDKKYGDSVELYGVEPSLDMLQQAENRLSAKKHVHLTQATAEKLPWADAYFDYVVSSLVLHHLPLAAKKAALDEMYRVLKPGGTLVLTDWGRPTNPLGVMIGFLWRKHAYVSENTKGILAPLLKEANFTHIHTDAIQFGIVHHVVAVKSEERQAWNRLAAERDTQNAGFVSHERAWK